MTYVLWDFGLRCFIFATELTAFVVDLHRALFRDRLDIGMWDR